MSTDIPAIEARLAADRDNFGNGYADQSIRDREALLAVVKELAGKLERVVSLATLWEARGEHDMKVAKTIRTGYIAAEILGHGALMVENARHIRNALTATEEA